MLIWVVVVEEVVDSDCEIASAVAVIAERHRVIFLLDSQGRTRQSSGREVDLGGEGVFGSERGSCRVNR